MSTRMHTRIVFENENCARFVPEAKVVDGLTFVKLEPKDRTFFKFATGHVMKIGKVIGDSRYMLQFFQDMVKARTNGCQAAFAELQADLRNADRQARALQANAEDGRPQKKARIRCRAIRDDDRETVGSHILVNMVHDEYEKEQEMRVLFGIKATPLWVEASETNLDFITACMTYDYVQSRFAPTRPRGSHFKKSSGSCVADEEGNHDGGDDLGDNPEGDWVDEPDGDRSGE